MSITLNQQSYLYSTLQRQNSSSELLNDEWWAITRDMDERLYKELLWLITHGQSDEATMLIKNLSFNKQKESI
jgi:hypothetical protein